MNTSEGLATESPLTAYAMFYASWRRPFFPPSGKVITNHEHAA